MEAVRHRPADPTQPCPPRPLHFDHRYELPLHRVKLLEQLHPHPLDQRIQFHEEEHIYEVDGKPAQCSVSGLAAEFESEFDPADGIRAMKRSRRTAWPRLDYVHNAVRVRDIDRLCGTGGFLLVNAQDGTTVASTYPNALANETGIVVLTVLRDQMKTKRISEGDEEWYTYDRVMEDDEIVEMWNRNGEDARNRGTEAHLQMELWLNSEQVRMDDGEVRVGLDFVKRCLVPLGAKAYRTEWTIFGKDENVAGCIDLALILPSGDLFLVDWKRSEKLAKKMYGYSRMTPPLDHLEDCSGCAYAIQLSSYQYLIEKYYGKRVVGRCLASIHPDAPFTTVVPYMKDEVEYIMQRQRTIATARREMSEIAKTCGVCCAQTNMLVQEAFVTHDGETYDAKCAKLRPDLKGEIDETRTSLARQMLNDRIAQMAVPCFTKSWKEHFPSPNDDLTSMAERESTSSR